MATPIIKQFSRLTIEYNLVSFLFLQAILGLIIYKEGWENSHDD